MRAERLAPGRGASSAGGTRHGPGGAARNPRRVGRASPGPARHEHGLARRSQGPCASSVTPKSRHADADVRPVVRQDGNHLEFECFCSVRGHPSAACGGPCTVSSGGGSRSLTCDLEHALGLGPPPARCRRVGRRDGYLPVCGSELLTTVTVKYSGPMPSARPDAARWPGPVVRRCRGHLDRLGALQRSLVAAPRRPQLWARPDVSGGLPNY